MAHVIDGRAAADGLCRELRESVDRMRTIEGIRPSIAVVLVGEDPASKIYVASKIRRCAELGIESRQFRLAADVAEADLLRLIADLNCEPGVHAILVQLPLPRQIRERQVIEAIDPNKDVDGFHMRNVGALTIGEPVTVPCTPYGVLRLLRMQRIDLAGRHAVIVGRSNIVGKPMAALLLREHCTVTVAHSKTANLPDVCRLGDILVAAVGKPRFIQGDWVKPGAVVIDVGINRVEVQQGYRVVGDVDFDAVASVAAAITPVPGGVGPMTIACLMENTVLAARRISAGALYRAENKSAHADYAAG